MATLSSLLPALDASDDVAYLLGPDRRIARVSPGWSRFALANGGGAALGRWERGEAPLDDALPPPLRAFYLDAFARALESGEPWEHDYECSSDGAFRLFRMTAYPVEGRCLVVVHSLRVEAPHGGPEHPPGEAYAARGVVVSCAHCRRVRHPAGRWDWVPAYVRAPPPNLSHGMCEPCCAFYWGDLADEP